MNEQIKQLAEQAGWMMGDEVEGFNTRLEKFAELIVRECINEIHVADVGDLKGKGYYLDKVAEHLEQHFGIEYLQPCKSPYCECDVNKCSHPGFYDARGES